MFEANPAPESVVDKLKDWRSRHGTAALHANEVARLAGRVGESLRQLAGCECEQAALHRAIAALRAELSSVERLASEIECVDHYQRAHG